MSRETSLKVLGDWKSEIGVPLETALQVSMDLAGRTGEEACRHALILMAQSAKATAKIAPKERPVSENPLFVHLLRKSQYKAMAMQGKNLRDYYRFMADKWKQPPERKQRVYANVKKAIAPIKNRGLAKRSWLWSLSKLGPVSEGSTEIPGTSDVYAINQGNTHGFQKENRIKYILMSMPMGWGAEVERKAANKILAQAALKLERQFQSVVGKAKVAALGVARVFFKV